MTYRITLRARHEVAEWENHMTQEYDKSGKGKSALFANAYGGLHAEVLAYT